MTYLFEGETTLDTTGMQESKHIYAISTRCYHLLNLLKLNTDLIIRIDLNQNIFFVNVTTKASYLSSKKKKKTNNNYSTDKKKKI